MAAKKKIEMIGKVSNASVLKGSGKDWSAWITLLDKASAAGWTHQETVAFLRAKHKLNWWWSQGVAYGYQIHKGIRVEGQSLKGDYSVTATKVFHMSKKKLWNVLSSPEGISAWLQPMSDFELIPKSQYEVEGGIYGEVRTMKSPERARLSWKNEEWEKATVVQVQLFGQDEKKSGLAFMHMGLKSVTQREAMRKHWKEALVRLSDVVNSSKK